MASVIKAGNATDGVQVTSDNTGILELKTGTGSGTTAVTIGTDQSVTFAGAISSSGNQTVTGNLTVDGNTTLGNANTDTILMTAAPSIGGAGLGMGFGFRNRIINGDMRIDQRNAGASVTASNTSDAIYVVDRWAYRVLAASKISLQRSTVAPAGFTNSLLITSLSAYTIGSGEFLTARQPIEGFNVADLGWGAAGASSVTLSFKVRSSLTGTFGGYIANASADRFYVFSYTINSANTWETKTITIAGDTSGTWNTANSIGLMLGFSVAAGSTYQGSAGSWGTSAIVAPTGQVNLAGTNGATFYITGVQLEKGSTATSFDYRPYGTELALCQRYYFRVTAGSTVASFCIGRNATTSLGFGIIPFPVAMRIAPTALEQTGTAADYDIRYLSSTSTCTSVPAVAFAGTTTNASVQFTTSAVLTAGQGCELRGTNAFLGWSAEL